MPNVPISGAIKADKSTTVTGTNGLTGGGDLSANRTLEPVYGSTANTVTQGNDPRLSDSRAPTGPAGGDLDGSTYPNPVLSAWQENPIALSVPLIGQVPTWNGSAWVPSAQAAGGSGGGDLIYYFNYGTPAVSPVAGLPADTKQLGRTASVPPSSVTSSTLPTGGTFATVAAFVTDPNDPNSTSISAGLWDFNLWASAPSAAPDAVFFRVEVYKYDGTTKTLLATSENVYLYVPTVVKQYTISTVLPQTALLASDRILIEVEASASVSGKTLTLAFGGPTPAHTHTTIPTVTGTGIVHVIDGAMQSPASPVNLTAGADVTGILPVANGGTGQATALVVDATTASNNAASTGVTVNTGTASIGVTDAGHFHAITDPQHNHSVGSTTATNATATTGISLGSTSATVAVTDPTHTHTVGSTTLSGGTLTLVQHEFWRPQNTGDRLATLTQPATTTTFTVQLGATRTIDVVFFKNWDGGVVTVNGTDIFGNPVSESYTKTAPLGTAQTVTGTKLFTFLTANGITSTVPGIAGADKKVEVDVGARIAVSNAPVAAFLKATVEGDGTPFTFTDLATGVFETAAAYGGKHLEVWYSVSAAISLGSHTHALTSSSTGVTASSPAHTHSVTDGGHTHAQSAHAHTLTSAATSISVNTATTGVTAADSGHSHGVTDPQHSHAQASHTHSLS